MSGLRDAELVAWGMWTVNKARCYPYSPINVPWVKEWLQQCEVHRPSWNYWKWLVFYNTAGITHLTVHIPGIGDVDWLGILKQYASYILCSGWWGPFPEG